MHRHALEISLGFWLIAASAFAQSAQFHNAILRNAQLVQSSGAAWTPANLGSSLKIWLKNESLTGNNGDKKSSWVDSSGNNWYGTNSNTSQQPYVTNTGTFGTGVKSLYFENPAVLHMSNGVSVFRNVASASVVVVFQPVDQAASRWLFNASIPTAANARFGIQVQADDTWWIMGRRLDADSNDASTTAGALTPLPIILQADADWGDTAAYAWTNSVSAISDTTWASANGNTSDTDSLYVSLCNSGTGNTLQGWVAEVLVVVPKLSATDRTNLYNYLHAKFPF